MNETQEVEVDQAQDVVTPEVVTPDVVTPDVVTPEVVIPDVVIPDVVTPDVVIPDVVTPDVVTPEVEIDLPLNETQIDEQIDTFIEHHQNATIEEIEDDLAKFLDVEGESLEEIELEIEEAAEAAGLDPEAVLEQVEKAAKGAFGHIINDTKPEDVNDYEGGWGSYVKIGVIMLKVGFIIVMMLFGVIAHQKRSGCTAATPILLAYCVVLVGMVILDLTIKWIFLFFICIYVANYLNFIGLLMILRNIPTQEGHELQAKTTIYMWVMNGLYVALLIMACFITPPVCQHKKVYPFVLNMAGIMFLINAGFNFILYYYNFGLTWQGEKSVVEPHSTRKEIFGNTFHDKEDDKTKEMTTEKLKEVFDSMMKWYFWFQVFVSVYNIIMQILGRTVLHNSEDLACVGNGNQWVYQTVWGETFITLHIFCVLTQAVLIERVYYTIPHHAGLFEKKVHDDKDEFLAAESKDE